MRDGTFFAKAGHPTVVFVHDFFEQAARVPADILAKLNAEAKRAMQAPDVVRRMTLDGAEVVANSSQEFAAEVRAEYAKWRKLVKRPGMKF